MSPAIKFALALGAAALTTAAVVGLQKSNALSAAHGAEALKTGSREPTPASFQAVDELVQRHILAFEAWAEAVRQACRRIQTAGPFGDRKRAFAEAGALVAAPSNHVVQIQQQMGQTGNAAAAEYLGVVTLGFRQDSGIKQSADQAIDQIKRRLGRTDTVAAPDQVVARLRSFGEGQGRSLIPQIERFHEAYRGYSTIFYESGAMASDLMAQAHASPRAGSLDRRQLGALCKELQSQLPALVAECPRLRYPHATLCAVNVGKMLAALHRAEASWDKLPQAGPLQAEALGQERDRSLQAAAEFGDQALKALHAINRVSKPQK